MAPPNDSGILLRPEGADCILVLAHGAGAGMRHPFLEGMAEAIAAQGIATFRYEFPYRTRGEKRPDPPAVLTLAVAAAIQAARTAAPDLPLLAGGKSLGGRMTSTCVAERQLPDVRGLVFLGFPLHPPGQPSARRAAHLAQVGVPMLFLQGTRDEFARLDLLEQVGGGLGDRASLHLVQEADHGFRRPKRLGTEEEVRRELAQVIARWARRVAREGALAQ